MATSSRRGRPPKFGRRARTVAVTLPEDVIEALRAANPDVGRAIVALVGARTTALPHLPNVPGVSVAAAGQRQSLIVVNPRSFPAVPGCALMRISPDRAFIALEPGAGLADLEVAVIDHLARPEMSPDERAGLLELRRALRRWRKDSRITVCERAIVVLEGDVPAEGHR